MLVYRNEEGPYTKNDFELSMKIPHPQFPEFITYRHCNLPVMGVGPNGPEHKFFYLDKYIDVSPLKAINQEVEEGIAKKLIKFNKIAENGIIPTHVNQQKSIDSFIHNMAKYERDKTWIEGIQKFQRKGDIKVFLNDYFGLKPVWDGVAMFRKYNGEYQNKSQPSEWMSLIEFFPLLKKFTESLPFKYVGYVMLLKSPVQSPVLVHRDYYPTNHTVNFINFRLNLKPRPFYLYDFNSDTKTYINQDSKCFFFNEIDGHGVDLEPESQLTLRIEGEFLDSFKDQIGIGKSDIFNWDFEHCQKFLKSGKFKIEQNTDI